MSRPNRLRRSELSTPATNEKMIAKAAASDADLAFLDLEDSVAPAAKTGARANVVRGLTELDWGATTRAYRINGVHTPWCHDDLIEVVGRAGAAVEIVIVPKVKAPRDVWFVDDLLTQLELRHGLDVGRIGLEVLIEEAEALARVEEIAGCSPRIEALILGVGDLSASLGMRTGHIGASSRYPGDVWHHARARMIAAARAAGVDPIDGPYANFGNADGYRDQCAWSATLGAVGKWCIHPSQVPIANEVYAPTVDEIERATRIVTAVREAEERGDGAANVGGVMVDAATTRVFEVVLDRARLCGLA
jgi:citrate lyase subunit beta / citryl-CoA lyase